MRRGPRQLEGYSVLNPLEVRYIHNENGGAARHDFDWGHGQPVGDLHRLWSNQLLPGLAGSPDYIQDRSHLVVIDAHQKRGIALSEKADRKSVV